MTDVFLSYKAEDRSRLAPLVEALEADGLSVWWDAHIGGGDHWRETIQRELDAARCVLVAWSKASVGPHGQFVCDEAGRAQRRGVYLPIRIDKVEAPLGFGETQALPLQGWKGNREDPRYQALLRAVQNRLGIASSPVARRSLSRGMDRRAVLAGGAVAAASAGLGAWFLLKPEAAAANSIAVLPFANLSGDPAQKYFSDGIAEEVRGALARIPRLKVIGRTSSEIVRDSDAIIAARKLGVTRVVTGSVRRSPEMIRVAAQLVSGRDGVELWSEAYDRPAGDVLRIQSEIAQSVAEALSLTLGGPARSALTAGGTQNAAAQDLYLQGIALLRAGHNEAKFRAALKLFDAAIERDPRFADAYAHKAETLADLTGVYSHSAADFDRGYNEAIVVARRAIALAPNRALGHSALANALAGKLDVRGALAEYQRASALFAGETEVLGSYSLFMSHIGNPQEGLIAADKSLSLDPLNPRSHAMRSSALLYARRYEEAAASYLRVMELAAVPPVMAIVSRASCLMLLGKTAEARQQYARAPVDNVYRLTGEAVLDARLGDREGAGRKLATLREKFGDSAIYQQAQVHAQLGERDQAFAALNRSWDVRDPGLLGMRPDPYLDPLRNDPRFAALERKLGLP